MDQIDDTFENLKSDPLFRRDEMKVTCRKCDRGVRKWLTGHRSTFMDIYFTPSGPLQCKHCLGKHDDDDDDDDDCDDDDGDHDDDDDDDKEDCDDCNDDVKNR